MAGRIQQIIFRIFYSTSFTIVFLLTVAFCCAGPIDALYQSYRRGRYIDIFLLTGVYALVAIISIFLYASRLYTNRSILRDIPKIYLPIDKADLPGKRVWRLIEDCKSRSAVIAYQALPRARRIENELPHARERINTLLKPEHSKEYQIFEPQWGVINHPGWSGPGIAELPNLQYETVVAELTDLVEARAVSLIPVQQEGISYNGGSGTLNEYMIEVLRRPEEIGMRQYLGQLISLGVLEDDSLSATFLALYERARFAPDPLSEDEFKTLMRIFAEILRTIKPLDSDKLDIPTSPRDFSLPNKDFLPVKGKEAVSESSSLFHSDAGSVRHHIRSSPPRMSDDSVRSFTSQDHDQDPQYDHDQDPQYDHEQGTEEIPSWKVPTSRPPVLRKLSSQRTQLSIGKRRSSRQTSNRTRSPSNRARTSRNQISSNSNERDAASVRSAKSNDSGGSVVRLKRDFDVSREELPFEIRTTMDKD